MKTIYVVRTPKRLSGVHDAYFFDQDEAIDCTNEMREKYRYFGEEWEQYMFDIEEMLVFDTAKEWGLVVLYGMGN